MHSFTLLTLAASMVASIAAVPLGHAHSRFHSRDVAMFHRGTPNIDHETGVCGGTSGFVCATGFCCSKWGYCGQGSEYCDGDSSSSSSNSTGGDIPTATTIGVTSTTVATTTTGNASLQNVPTFATTEQNSATSTATAYQATSTAETSAASSPTASSSSPSTSSSAGSGGAGLGNTYTMYNGDGDANEGWPTTSSWVSFDTMWSANEADIMASCSQFGVADNSESETAELKSAIQSVGASSGVDPRFILAIVLQESAGCVRAPTTNYGVTNPGLMQSHDGAGSCNDNGSVQNPCPSSEITQMIEDGTEGTSSGDGLKQCLAQAPTASGAASYYQAARIYNSGSIAAGGNLGAGIATLCYSADIANRLTGWVNAPTTCTLDG